MKIYKILFIAFFIFASCNHKDEKCGKSSTELAMLIKSYEDRKSYDRDKYPLGLYTREYYKAEADYAENQLQNFACIKMDDLSETEQISVELLKFVLQDKIDFYKFERFLNPLLSDSGFHSSLNYKIRPLNNYWAVKEYLKKFML